MWVLAIINKQTTTHTHTHTHAHTQNGVGRVVPCCHPPFSHFCHAKKDKK